METSWWLDESGLPARLLWARLQVAADGTATVLDLDGRYHRFPGRTEAELWLAEDEYSRWEHLAAEGEVGPGVAPPAAPSDRELVPLMLVQLIAAEPSVAPDPRRLNGFGE